VWRCPSARASVTASWILPFDGGVWWEYLRDNVGRWGKDNPAGGPCLDAFPSGWGGSVTDSIAQRRRAGADTGAFECSIGTSSVLSDVQDSQVSDAAWLIVCGDTQHAAEFTVVADLLYSVCRTNECACGDWSSGETCMLPADQVGRWHSDPSFRYQYARHQGGANLGFADGHAKWWSAQELEASTPYCECCSPAAHLDGHFLVLSGRPLRGLCPAGVG
jgi:prepilin-type processing-associated H-X9-DG protein